MTLMKQLKGWGREKHTVRTTVYKSLQTTSTAGRDVTWEHLQARSLNRFIKDTLGILSTVERMYTCHR